MSQTVPSPAFEAAFTILIGHEGGYVSNAADPGGETKYGISKRSYPQVNIANLSEDDARQIYKRDFWDKLELDNCDPALALIAFDAACNNGVSAATKWLQAAVGVTADGVIGPATRAAIAKANVQAAITNLHGARIDMMAKLPTWSTFGGGWSKRLAALPWQAATLAASLGAKSPAS